MMADEESWAVRPIVFEPEVELEEYELAAERDLYRDTFLALCCLLLAFISPALIVLAYKAAF